MKLLSSGARDADPRQQTLEATIDWSYQLLTEQEQTFFFRCGVFVGGFRFDAAEAVIGANPGFDLLDGIDSLLAKSLLRRRLDPDREPRYWMLETIREFAANRLARSGDLESHQFNHALHFAALAEAAEPQLWGVDQALWSRRLDADHPNFRAALDWSLANAQGDIALRLAGAP